MSSLGSLFRFWAELRGWNWCWLRIDWAILRGYFSCHFLWTANIHSTSELPQWPTKLHFTWDRQILNTGGFNPVEQYHYNISQFQAWVQIEAKNGKHQNVIVEKDQYNTIHHTSPYSIRSHQQQSDKLANVGAMPPSCVPETEGDGINHYGAHWPPPTLATTRSSQNPKWNLGWSL